MFADSVKFQQPESRVPNHNDTEADKRFLDALNGLITRFASGEQAGGSELKDMEGLFRNCSFFRPYQRLILLLYAPGIKRILISRAARGVNLTFSSVFARLLHHARLGEFRGTPFRLQIDFVRKDPIEIDFYRVGMVQQGERHFEIGVDGLLFTGPDGRLRLFLPGDAYVRSIMGMRQLRDYLYRSFEEDYVRGSKFQRFQSDSYISSPRGCWLRLYRGHPVVGAVTKAKLEQAVEAAIDHIQLTQEESGKFLYYYDPVRDSRRDHEHPTRHPDKNPYYNILRHGGGGLTCVYYERYSNNGRSLENIRRAFDYFISEAREYPCEGRTGAYIYSERKAKLGGAGIGLYWLADYQLLNGDNRYHSWADKIAWHLLHQITESGEFIYYNIYLDKPVTAAENDRYFSFYYPGEAVCGLARYYPLASPEIQALIVERLKRALHFLLEIRPRTRAEHYTAVPSDSWLMMGIMELWDIPEMRDPGYARFVFSDARRMIDQMYKVDDAPYPDYAGAFYYEFGDYPYADGARCEGLLGAYRLALKMGEQAIAEEIWAAMRLAAWSVLHLCNSDDSVYAARKPELARGGIRFKYTRQWFRIDTIQHVASFFAKLLPYWDRGERGEHIELEQSA
jgi:hypothetical protein